MEEVEDSIKFSEQKSGEDFIFYKELGVPLKHNTGSNGEQTKGSIFNSKTVISTDHIYE